MDTVDDLFRAFGGTGAVAAALSVGRSTASETRRRESIPVRHWQRLVAEAERRGVAGLSYESLVLLHTGAKRGEAAAEPA